MDSKEYFETYKDKIKETAEFLCSKDPSNNLEDEFEKLKQQYLNCDGTCHNETISINSQDLNIHPWLEMIWHEPVENFVIIAVGGKQREIIYKTKGDQCSNYNLSDKAIRDSIGVCILKGIKNLGLFVFHNHPYIYKALPSSSDLDTLEAIKDAINDIENNLKDMNINCSITLLDFSIVTDFNYWSAIQSC